jgi:hypothetical protein
MKKVYLKHITLDKELVAKFVKVKAEVAKTLGIKSLSFNQYFAILYNQMSKK